MNQALAKLLICYLNTTAPVVGLPNLHRWGSPCWRLA